MRLMRLAEVPITERDKVFGYSRGRALIGTALLLTAITVMVVFSRSNRFWLGYYIAAVTLLAVFIFRKLVTARFRPANWLVRLTDDGLYIQLRSYLNHHFPQEDLTVVFIPHGEVRSARLVRQERLLPDRSESGASTMISRTQALVELELAGDTQDLAEALGRERDQVMTGKFLGKQSSRYRHLPVRLASADLLQIEWKVVPRAQTFLHFLSRHTLVLTEDKRPEALVEFEHLPQAEQEARLLRLAESGDMIGAVAMARKLYSYDLAAAKEFVEGLAGKRPRA